MHPPTPCTSINRVVYAVSVGLVVATSSLGWQGTLRQANAPKVIQSASRSEDDRGSGRLTRVPILVDLISFRGSGRINTNPPAPANPWQSPVAFRGSGRIDTNPPAPATSWHSPVAYRGSGRVTQPRTS